MWKWIIVSLLVVWVIQLIAFFPLIWWHVGKEKIRLRKLPKGCPYRTGVSGVRGKPVYVGSINDYSWPVDKDPGVVLLNKEEVWRHSNTKRSLMA
jgi:hypothetical protein